MRKAINELEIEYLVHFTQAENLSSIFKHGILPVAQQRFKNISAKRNDLIRMDFCEEATSTSIHFPNYKLFYKFRMTDQSVDWVVLALSSDILLEKQCAFCTDNAANSSISQQSLRDRMGADALRRMFLDIPGKPTRAVLGIADSTPTNPQAEVLVFDEIEPDYIVAIIFENKMTLEKYRHLLPEDLQVEVLDGYFAPRKDYIHWQREG
ncbi:DarT ssDNA thymidine ADP-ribosyltransferase family protein [Brevibacillus brevis]|uniref:DarT ssDNA thymidine ADP-ribosyltransferase family protein n=1 Tax=Brevibacillus brevis TaxID=1393 RepID=UPI0007D8B0F5|nr:DarT ssDNA thymidine ADP-ribosyltransferase family protein [Brevibacillus brevis]